MKKFLTKLFMVTVLLTMTTNVNAQKMTYPGVHLGLRVGPTFSSDGVGILGGLAFDFHLGKNPFYIETGAYFGVIPGLKGYDRDSRRGSDLVPCPMAPVLFSYHFYLNRNIALQPFAGGTIGYDLNDDEFLSTLRFGIGFNFKRLYLNVGYDLSYVEDFRQPSYFFTTLGFNIAGRR